MSGAKNRSEASRVLSLLSDAGQQLYGLSEIGQERRWDFSLPTITKHSRFMTRLSITSEEPFLQIIRNFGGDLTMWNLLACTGLFETKGDVCLAGGAIVDILTEHTKQISDWDLYLVGE